MFQAKLGDLLHSKRKNKNKIDYWCDLEGKASSPTTQQHASTSWRPIYSEITHEVGWKNVNMALYYTQCEKVFSKDLASSVLADSSSAKALLLGKNFRKRNALDKT